MWPSPATATSELRHTFANPLCHIAAPKAGRTPADVGKLPPPKQFRMDERGRVALNLCAVKTILLSLALIAETALIGFAQGTAFTYQGRLNNSGNPANGNFDFTFTVFGTNSGGSPITETITNPFVSVNNGLFVSTLDFGSFLTGNPAWLEIGVRSNGNGGFVTLVPRQQLTPTPYAMFANTASNVVGAINGNLIAAGTIGAAQIAPGSIGATQLAPAAANGLLNLQLPNSTNLQAGVNCSYLFTNLMANQLTLPANPNVGDRVRVTGGAGGFTLIANIGQSVYSLPGFTWTMHGVVDRYCVASSSDGCKLVAAGFNGGIFTSTNFGLTWIQQTNTGSASYNCVASSSDGGRIVIGTSDYLYLSTNFGGSWMPLGNAGNAGWSCVASSSDGGKLLAGGNHEYFSADYGTTWSYNTANLGNGVGEPFAALSDDGKVLYDGTIVSTNSGTNFTYWAGNNNSEPPQNACVACSRDGSKVLAGQPYADTLNGFPFISTNYGVTWLITGGSLGTSLPDTGNWKCVTMSGDGTKLAAAQSNGYIYLSTDSGNTWSQQTAAGVGEWCSIVFSSDGSRLIAGQNNGHYFVRPNYITQWSTVYVYGGPYANMELVYTGGGLWTPAFYTGNFTIQ